MLVGLRRSLARFGPAGVLDPASAYSAVSALSVVPLAVVPVSGQFQARQVQSYLHGKALAQVCPPDC